jgi:hypothetical protein
MVLTMVACSLCMSVGPSIFSLVVLHFFPVRWISRVFYSICWVKLEISLG